RPRRRRRLYRTRRPAHDHPRRRTGADGFGRDGVRARARAPAAREGSERAQRSMGAVCARRAGARWPDPRPRRARQPGPRDRAPRGAVWPSHPRGRSLRGRGGRGRARRPRQAAARGRLRRRGLPPHRRDAPPDQCGAAGVDEADRVPDQHRARPDRRPGRTGRGAAREAARGRGARRLRRGAAFSRRPVARPRQRAPRPARDRPDRGDLPRLRAERLACRARRRPRPRSSLPRQSGCARAPTGGGPAAMRENPVKRKLAAGGVALGTMVFEFATTGIARLAAGAGAEFVVFDQEHTGASLETVRMFAATARACELVPLVRVPATEYHLLAGALYVGPMGVKVPMVESAEQARKIVASAKYPPVGRRGVWILYRDDWVDGSVAATMEQVNCELLLIAPV